MPKHGAGARPAGTLGCRRGGGRKKSAGGLRLVLRNPYFPIVCAPRQRRGPRKGARTGSIEPTKEHIIAGRPKRRGGGGGGRRRRHNYGPPKKKDDDREDKAVQVEGMITSVLAGTMFKVELPSGHEVLAHISGKMRKRFIKLVVGDKVKMEMSPYDTSKARIVFRVG